MHLGIRFNEQLSVYSYSSFVLILLTNSSWTLPNLTRKGIPARFQCSWSLRVTVKCKVVHQSFCPWAQLLKRWIALSPHLSLCGIYVLGKPLIALSAGQRFIQWIALSTIRTTWPKCLRHSLKEALEFSCGRQGDDNVFEH